MRLEGRVDLLDHPDWPLLLGFLYIRRGHDGVNGPRHRIEVAKAAPADRVFAIRTRCAHCGLEIQNVRADKRGAWTMNVSCPLEVDPKCSRMPATTRLCTRIRELMGGDVAREGALF